jgi:uncharacterized protein (DUF2236 family)
MGVASNRVDVKQAAAAAERMIERVKRMHTRVNGTRPDGVPYRALEPELIAWVHSSIPWAVMHAYERFNQPLTREQKDRYLAEQSVIALKSGADEVPTTVTDMEAFIEEMRPKLGYTDMLGEFFDFLERGPLGALVPPGPLAGPVKRLQVASGMSMAPRWAQEMTGYDRPKALQRFVYAPSMQSYARVLRWAYGKPPWRRLAEQRLGIDAPAQSTKTPRIGTPVSA